jgi:predicted ATPase/DNA-binding SARP family transcriptional activator
MRVETLDPDRAPLVIRLFGEVEVFVRGQPWTLPEGRRRVAWLLGYLALHGNEGVRRAVLEATFWPKASLEQAQKNLRNLLSHLRTALGAEGARVLSPSRTMVRLDLTDAEVDLVAFDQALLRGDTESQARAAEMHRGPLLQGCCEEWAREAREQREQGFLRALDRLAEDALIRGDETMALSWAERAVSADPFRESTQRVRMKALAAQGNRAAALLAYRRCSHLLRRELETEPEPETTALYQRIRSEARVVSRNRAPAPAAANEAREHRYSPRSSLALIGRDPDLRAVCERLDGCRLITLVGVGGVGKSSLADHVVQAVLARRPDWSAAFIALDAINDPALVPLTVARELGLHVRPDQSVLQAMIAALAATPFLLILDNCEHLLDACASLVRTLLANCPQLRILTTSRERLGLAEEANYALSPLAVPDREWSDDPGGLDDYPATRLFLTRAGLTATTLSRETAPIVVQICRRLDGIPLAIELAAARIRSRSLSLPELGDGLQRHSGFLARNGAAAPPRHRTLERAIDWSYRLLTEPEQALLRRLSVFVGGWTLEAAEAICEHAAPKLLDLVEKSLVVAEPLLPSVTRYRLLETIRHYAREKLRAAGEEEDVRRRHAEHFLDLAERAAPELAGPDPRPWLDHLEADLDNLRTGLEALIEWDETEAGLRLAEALRDFWNVRGYHTEARTTLHRLLALSGAEAPTTARAGALQALIAIEDACGRTEEAYRLALEHVELRRRLAEPCDLGHGLGLAAFVGLQLWKLEEAEALAQEGLAVAWGPDDLAGRPMALLSLGLIAQKRCHLGAAEGYFRECLRVRLRIGSARGVATSLQTLGGVAMERGDHAQARSYFEESLAIRREIDDRSGLVSTLGNLARLAIEQGEDARARALTEEGIALTRAQGCPQAGHLAVLGELALRQGKLDEARNYFEQCYALHTQNGHSLAAGSTLLSLAYVAFHQRDYAQAESLCEQSLARCPRQGSPSFLFQMRVFQGTLRMRQGDVPGARSLLANALLLYRRENPPVHCVDAFERAAELTVTSGQPELAARLLGAADAERERWDAPAPVGQAEYDTFVHTIRGALGETAFTNAREAGRSLSVAQAVDLALGELDPASG